MRLRSDILIRLILLRVETHRHESHRRLRGIGDAKTELYTGLIGLFWIWWSSDCLERWWMHCGEVRARGASFLHSSTLENTELQRRVSRVVPLSFILKENHGIRVISKYRLASLMIAGVLMRYRPMTDLTPSADCENDVRCKLHSPKCLWWLWRVETLQRQLH